MDNAVLTMCVGELFWEIGRFVPHILWLKQNIYKDSKFIVMTYPDRYDAYGTYADTFVPITIDKKKHREDCFRLDDFSLEKYEELANSFKLHFSKQFNIKKLIYPVIKDKIFMDKNQFPKDKMSYDYKPRKKNLEIVNSLKDGRPIIIIAPRFRANIDKRNWNNWNEFYDLVCNSKLNEKYQIVLCGKKGDYIPDKKNRFLDINNIEKDKDISLIGLTIEFLRAAKITIGSQSAIPNLSLLLKTPAIEWGNQRQLHTADYNVKNTPVYFYDDEKFNLPASFILNETKKILGEK